LGSATITLSADVTNRRCLSKRSGRASQVLSQIRCSALEAAKLRLRSRLQVATARSPEATVLRAAAERAGIGDDWVSGRLDLLYRSLLLLALPQEKEMTAYKQDAPFAVQIELVEGCTLACNFCGINGIRQMPGNFKHMTLGTAAAIGSKIANSGWNPRIEFAMHGEPSVHPQLFDIIEVFRDLFGKKTSMVMFSNGSGFMADTTKRINGLLDAGINTLGLDAYEHVNIVPRVVASYEGPYPVYRYPKQPEHNLHSGRRVGHKDIVIIKDILAAKAGNHASLNTHCGGGMEAKDLPLQKRCAKPFRELSIRWDGNVALCCNDFRGVYKIGSLIDLSLDEIWNHSRLQAARKKLYQSDRDFNPCQFCNAKSMRVGLLPDIKGRVELDPPSTEDEALLKEAVQGDPYTKPVMRMWELMGASSFPGKSGQNHPVNMIPDQEDTCRGSKKRTDG
jgi:radical SAM protein with 4Fe4S-binding SPASM domain